jgi:hypothetical protein
MVEKASELERERDKKQAQDEQMVAQRLKASLGPQIWIPKKERRRESDQLKDGGADEENGAAGEGERSSTGNFWKPNAKRNSHLSEPRFFLPLQPQRELFSVLGKDGENGEVSIGGILEALESL